MISQKDLKEQFTNEIALRKINHHLVNTLGLPKGKYLLTSFRATIGDTKIHVRFVLELADGDDQVHIKLEGRNIKKCNMYNWGIHLPHDVRIVEEIRVWNISGYLTAIKNE